MNDTSSACVKNSQSSPAFAHAQNKKRALLRGVLQSQPEHARLFGANVSKSQIWVQNLVISDSDTDETRVVKRDQNAPDFKIHLYFFKRLNLRWRFGTRVP
jgi:hypothetical protein